MLDVTPPDEQHEDWADRLALEMAIDFATRGSREARTLVAARLRKLKADSILEGHDSATKAALAAIDNYLGTKNA